MMFFHPYMPIPPIVPSLRRNLDPDLAFILFAWLGKAWDERGYEIFPYYGA